MAKARLAPPNKYRGSTLYQSSRDRSIRGGRGCRKVRAGSQDSKGEGTKEMSEALISGSRVEAYPTPRPALKTNATAQAGGKKGHSCKPLPTRFRRGEFDFRQIVRDGQVAIYEQSWGGCADPSVCFELIRIRRREGFQIGARFVGPAEVYPNSEAWGVDGFTLTKKDAAFRKRDAAHIEAVRRRMLAVLQQAGGVE
jgi:hypothetical protein